MTTEFVIPTTKEEHQRAIDEAFKKYEDFLDFADMLAESANAMRDRRFADALSALDASREWAIQRLTRDDPLFRYTLGCMTQLFMNLIERVVMENPSYQEALKESGLASALPELSKSLN